MSPAECSLLEHVRATLAEAQFDPTHAGDIFLQADAEAALQAALPTAVIAVAGRDDARLPTARFLGATYRPDLLVESDTARVAVGLTLLRSDAGLLAAALARAVVLSQQLPVTTVIVDRRVECTNPFAGPSKQRLHPNDQAVDGLLGLPASRGLRRPATSTVQFRIKEGYTSHVQPSRHYRRNLTGL